MITSRRLSVVVVGAVIVVGVGVGCAPQATAPALPFVFVIALENKSERGVVGNPDAPFLNDVIAVEGGRASSYRDVLPDLVSEPHYLWLEAGTNAFDDHTFEKNAEPSSSNSTADTRHLATALVEAGKEWRSYQEGLDDDTGACPIHNSGFYAAKHDPFVFFHDVAGSPPSADNAFCAEHHRAYDPASFAADLAADDVVDYTFITPNLCHDMHGKKSCENGCTSKDAPACIAEGDRWLSENAPPILDFLERKGGALLFVWDETEGQDTQPFFIAGPTVRKGVVVDTALDHSSYVRSIQTFLGLDVDARVAGANDFGGFFVDDD